MPLRGISPGSRIVARADALARPGHGWDHAAASLVTRTILPSSLPMTRSIVLTTNRLCLLSRRCAGVPGAWARRRVAEPTRRWFVISPTHQAEIAAWRVRGAT